MRRERTKHLSEKTQFSTQKIRTAIAHLQKSGEIVSKSTNKNTVINIVKWRVYQSFETCVQQTTNKQLTNKQQTNSPHILKNTVKKITCQKQEMIKNASPELVAMAEQLKTMLSALPENSPELLAIRQSPMYKQVAVLIEN